VPMEVTVKLLENAMTAAMQEKKSGEGWSGGHGRFLIDGFPRKMDQAFKFDSEVCRPFLNVIDCIYQCGCIGLRAISRFVLHHDRRGDASASPGTWKDQRAR
jgi:hypothetical protein